MKFKKLEKLYSIGYYLKSASYGSPRTLSECLEYLKEHKSLPFKPLDFKNWMYEFAVEKQRKGGVYADQFFTPPNVAKQLVEVLESHVVIFKDDRILDVAAGFGMLTMALDDVGYRNVYSVESDAELMESLIKNTPAAASNNTYDDYVAFLEEDSQFDVIVSNPSFNQTFLDTFWGNSKKILNESGAIVMILPTDFFKIKKEQNLRKVYDAGFSTPYNFGKCCEDFFHTKAACSIFHIEHNI